MSRRVSRRNQVGAVRAARRGVLAAAVLVALGAAVLVLLPDRGAVEPVAPAPEGPAVPAATPRQPRERAAPADATTPPAAPAEAPTPPGGPEGGTAALLVTDAHTSAPIERAVVVDTTGPGAANVTDTAGIARVDLPAGVRSVALWVAAPGYVGRSLRVDAQTGAKATTEVPLTAVAMARSVTVVRGRVVDASGVPAAAELTATDAVGTGTTARSAPTGDFELQVPSDLGRVLITADTGRERGAAYADVGTYRTSTAPPYVEIRTAGSRLLVVRIGGVAARDAGPDGFVLVGTPMLGSDLAGPSARWTVRDGARIEVRPGLAAFRLQRDDGSQAAPGLVALVTADGAVRMTAVNTSGGSAQRYLPDGPASDTLPFEVRDPSVARVVVQDRATGAPLPGLEVRLEDAALADPFERQFVEVPEREWRPGHPTVKFGLGRRAPPTHVRREVTGADGAAQFRGWLPRPAVLTVSGPGVVPVVSAVAEFPEGDLVIPAEPGGTVRVALPPALADCVLENLASGLAVRVDANDPVAAIPPGAYCVRLSPSSGMPRVVLAERVDVAAGREVRVDLAAAAAWCEDRLHLGIRGMVHAVCSFQQAGSRSSAPVADGTATLRFFAPRRRQQLDVLWADGAATHVHDVEYEVPSSAGAALDVDLSYDAADVRFAVTGAAAGDVLSLQSRGSPAAPHARSHFVRVRADGAKGWVVRLPGGTYQAEVEGSLSKSVSPREFTVAPGETATVQLAVEDLSVVVRVLDAATGRPALAVPPLRVAFVPVAGASPARLTGVVREDGAALVRRVPDGEYRLEVTGTSKTQNERGLYPSYVLTSEVVSVTPTSRAFDVKVPER